MKGVNADGVTIDRLKELGTIAFESTGWGTGEIQIKCRSNTRCEKESLNKPVITFTIAEADIKEDEVEAYAIQELSKKLAAKEVKILSVEDKKYNAAKRKFKVWKNEYKREHQF